MNELRTRFYEFAQANWQPLGLLFVAWVAFFSPLLFGGKVYFLDDLKIIYFPLEYVYAQAQQAFELPVWSNYFGFGQPVLAWGQLGFFTPLHVILRALLISPLALLQVSVMGYYAIGLVGMFVFLRRFVSGYSAALGSLVFVFSGFHIGHLNHVNFYTATMLWPWLLVAIEQFIRQPTLRRTVMLSLLGAAMALSGQPQIVSYSFVAALIVAACLGVAHIARARQRWRAGGRIIIYAALASIIAFCLASFAILPLYEFIPITDRAGALPEAELFEFSYPPYHAITLLFPYFFGDHAHYVGPKGFQELAAFVGIIPLLLAGLIFVRWKQHWPLKLAVVTLALGGVTLALGRYSPIYTWLVQEKIITAIAVPGRFVFFFDIAIALAAALGLETLRTYSQLSFYQRLGAVVGLFSIPAIVLAGFFWQMQFDVDLYHRLLASASLGKPGSMLLLAGVVVVLAALAIPVRLRIHKIMPGIVVAVATATLLVMGWDYNPRTDLATIGNLSPFLDTLRQYEVTTGLPARLYAAQTILAAAAADPATHHTERIGPDFTIHQLILVRKPQTNCIEFPARITPGYVGTVTVTLRTELLGDPLETVTLAPADFVTQDSVAICLARLPEYVGKTVIISFTSLHPSPLELLYRPYTQGEEAVYFVRKEQPTSEQLRVSKKEAQLIFTPYYPTTGDFEAIYLARHLHVLAHTSSARWISALSIGNYRDFIEGFFANDRPAIDGDGVHALVRNRTILNMAGVTHLAQTLPLGADDGVVAAGYTLLDRFDFGAQEVRLYANPQVLPKAFLVSRAVFKPAADETRYAMSHEPYDPREVAFVTGTKPPPELLAHPTTPLTGTATITHYNAGRVDVAVATSRDAFLLVTDATTPQWQTYIDDRPAAYYVANTVFKAALVPAGQHTVSFRYYSPAIALSKKLTVGGVIAVVALLLMPLLIKRVRTNGLSSAQ